MNNKERNKKYNDANKEYRNRFAREKYRSIIVRFRDDNEHDKELYSHVKRQNNMNSYVKGLIEDDLAK